MKREIKFRAWDEGNKVIHNDFQFIKSGNEGNDWIIFISDKHTLGRDELRQENKSHPFNDPYFAQQLKIMQYTGLKDKNGKEIYEGDILHRMLFDKTIGTIDVFAQVLYNSKAGLFEAVSPEENFFETVISDFEWQVVGNIYENPELL